MDFATTLFIAVGLAMDAFSVAIGAGISIPKPDFRHYFRISFHFGLFQFMMPVIGYFAGRSIEPVIKNYDHWLAMILLAATMRAAVRWAAPMPSPSRMMMFLTF